MNGSISLKTTTLYQFSGHGNHIVLTFDYHIPRFYALFEYDLHVASPTITLYIDFNSFIIDVEILLTHRTPVCTSLQREMKACAGRWEGVTARFAIFRLLQEPMRAPDFCYFYWDTQREPLRRRERLYWEFSIGTNQKTFTFNIPTGISGVANDKQPG